MFSPSSTTKSSNSSLIAAQPTRTDIAQNLLSSLHLVRQLFAYYANWRSASRVFDEALDSTLQDAVTQSDAVHESLYK
jgi:hypothetical protein